MLQEIRDKIFEKESYKNCGQQYLKKLEWYSLFVHWNIWGKIFKNGPSKICGRQPLKNLKWYGFHRKNLYVKLFSVIFRAFIKIKFHRKSFLGNISKFFLEVLNNSFFWSTSEKLLQWVPSNRAGRNSRGYSIFADYFIHIPHWNFI